VAAYAAVGRACRRCMGARDDAVGLTVVVAVLLILAALRVEVEEPAAAVVRGAIRDSFVGHHRLDARAPRRVRQARLLSPRAEDCVVAPALGAGHAFVAAA